MNLTDTGTDQGADLAGNTPSRQAPARRKSKAGDKAPKQPAGRTRTVSKQAGVIKLLRRRQGASVAAIMKSAVDAVRCAIEVQNGRSSAMPAFRRSLVTAASRSQR